MYEKIIMWHIRFPPKAHVTIYSISISIYIYIYICYVHTHKKMRGSNVRVKEMTRNVLMTYDN